MDHDHGARHEAQREDARLVIVPKDILDPSEGAIHEAASLVQIASQPNPDAPARKERQAALHGGIAGKAVPLDLLSPHAQIAKSGERDLGNTLVVVGDPDEGMQ